MRFGDLSRLDGYNPEGGFKDTFRERFGAAPLSAEEAAALRQRQFTNRQQASGAERAERVAPAVMGGLADLSRAVADPIVTNMRDYSTSRVAAPGPMTEEEAWRINNPGIGQSVWETAKMTTPLRNPLGPVSQFAARGGQLFGGILDPRMWHGIAANKLVKPLTEMFSEHAPTQAIRERIISPERLQGGVLLPVPGDRSMTGERLLGVGGQRFDVPVDLQGGHGFMPANADRGHVWASDQAVITTLAGRAKDLQDKYGKVYLPYSTMGERSVDFSHHMSDTLSEMLKNAKIIKASRDPNRATAATFDEAMKNASKEYKAVGDWPGVLDPNLRDWLINAPGKTRDKFAKLMDTGPYQSGGFPNVAEARLAVTDPRLLYDPSGAAGMSIARANPSVVTRSGHRTYDTALGGEYIGGFGQSVPKEVMYPDIFKAYAQRRTKHGVPLDASQTEYAFRIGTPPFYQETNQQWLDGVMRYLGKR